MKRRVLFFCFSIVIVSIIGIVVYKNKDNNKDDISKILSSEEYSYLPKEAQNYIRQVYEESGTIVKTEKNKESNEPYLNPVFVNYLTLTPEEKEHVEVIPEPYVVGYIPTDVSGDTEIPETYDLRNVDGNNYITPLKNQGELGICWAFSSIENVETLLLINSNQSYNSNFKTFSVRQLDYLASINGLKNKYLNNGTTFNYDNSLNSSRELGEGGNFTIASLAMASGATLVDESVLPWNISKDRLFAKDIINYNNSKYEMDGTVEYFGSSPSEITDDKVQSFTDAIKSVMLTYGGPMVSTYSPQSTCTFKNSDNNYVIKVDECASVNAVHSHAMQIIGWNDNYSYRYCDAGTNHSAPRSNGTCASGATLKTGKGAWILRNSWGSNYSYVYLTYDSAYLNIGFSISLSDAATRKWNNNYHHSIYNGNVENGVAYASEITDSFNKKTSNQEKIEKIKLYNLGGASILSVSITNGDKTYNSVATSIVPASGIFTFDISDKDIILEDKDFSVTVKSIYGAYVVKNSISVFTSNVEEDPYTETYSSVGYESAKPLSKDNPAYVKITGTSPKKYSFKTETYFKNVENFPDVSYRLKKDSTTATSFGDQSIISDIDVVTGTFTGTTTSYNSYFNLNNEIGETWTMEIVQNNQVIDSFPVKFYTDDQMTKSKVRLYANNGTTNYLDVGVTDKSTYKFGDVNGLTDFYNSGHYIVSWNTAADGSGTSYTAEDGVYVYHDIELYAQWSDDYITFDVVFQCNESNDCTGITGSVDSIEVGYNDKITMPRNGFTYPDHAFNIWKIKKNNSTYSFRELVATTQKANYYAVYPNMNHAKIVVYATWLSEYYTITFDSNGGLGSMPDMNVTPNSNATLSANLYTKPSYTFAGWNTEADGSGTAYANKARFKVTSNMTLYAQWEKEEGKSSIIFHSNYDEDQVKIQEVVGTETATLEANTFTRDNYKFVKWNTKADGTGTSYDDGAVINITDNINLYAQWESTITYIINDYPYSVEDKYITRITVGTTVEEFRTHIVLGEGYSVEVNTKSVNGKEVLYTGGKTTILRGNDIEIAFSNVVLGDVNGDGKLSALDYVNIKNHIMRTNVITDNIKLLSADPNVDNKISALDYVYIKNYIMNGGN